MEWKLERAASKKVKTDEDMLWEKVMKTLEKDLKHIRKQSLQKLIEAVLICEVKKQTISLPELPEKPSNTRPSLINSLSEALPMKAASLWEGKEFLDKSFLLEIMGKK